MSALRVPIDLPNIDWVVKLPEVGRPFERQVERWRELERQYIEQIKAARQTREWMREIGESVTTQVEELWTANEIKLAKEEYASEVQP